MKPSDKKTALFVQVHSNQIIEDLMSHFKQDINLDFLKYKNHVYRVFLNCVLRDPDPAHVEKYAIAAVFHDIGIWTDHTIDYLDPSIAQVKKYLGAQKLEHLTDEITLMIYWHHKISRYRGQYEQTVETFRKADWTDVSLGILTFGADRQMVAQNRKMLGNEGFHVFLIMKILQNLLKKPLKPLPMFKI